MPKQKAKAMLTATHLDQLRTRLERDPTPPRLSELASELGLSSSQLLRRFRERHGLTPAQLVRANRERHLRGALKRGRDVTTAIYDAGFGAASRVYENAASTLGMTPAAYRRGAPAVAIRYTVIDSALGKLLVATTSRGICAVTLGDDERALAAGLAAEFPRAELTRVDEGADEWIGRVAARVAAELGLSNRSIELPPLDVQATAFQWKVWRELQRIPRGATCSYADIATRVGRPRAARAVARAIASNRLALIVPCHRVVRSDGTLGGYRWGVPRKEKALALEKAPASMAP